MQIFVRKDDDMQKCQQFLVDYGQSAFDIPEIACYNPSVILKYELRSYISTNHHKITKITSKETGTGKLCTNLACFGVVVHKSVGGFEHIALPAAGTAKQDIQKEEFIVKTITDLIKDVPVPRMVKIRQVFDTAHIPEEEIAKTVQAELSREALGGQIKPGMKIAITCGSRGINHNAIMARAIVDFVKDRGAEPYIVAAMGSHGGATAEGQLQILHDYGITEENMGCPIRSSMETVQIGLSGVRQQPVFIDKYASEADGIILYNRVKPHTSFRGRYESGLMKMMAIGLGKQHGAESIHHQSPAIMHELVEEYGKTILENCPILGGIAIIENAYDETCLIKGLTPQEIVTEEPKLRDLSYQTIAHLLFDKCDVLVVDKIGKNISGDGMDPNVSGRFVLPAYCSGGIEAEKVVILDLTDETHGNAQGIGLAEVTTRRLFDKMKLEMTYPTGVTNTFLHLMKIPMIMDNDREAMQLALCCCPEAEDPDNMKMIRIPDTAHIEYVEISEGLLPLAQANPHIEILSEPYELPFDEAGNLF